MSWPERLRSIAAAFIGLLLAFTPAKYLGEWGGINEWLLASLGVSALLVFALLGSPMARSRAVVADNTLSALVRISCFQLISQ